MENTSENEKKEKRHRGSNWMPQALKVCLEMGILKRVKIKGCEAIGDVRDGAWQEISDNVSATGQIKTPQECFNKLRTYPSEVKLKYLGIAKRTVLKSGSGGGTPVKKLQPSEIETLALSFLGIEKVAGIVGGRKTSLKPKADFDYIAERKKEWEAGADLEKKLAKVTSRVKALGQEKYGINTEGASDDDNADVDSLLCGPSSGKGKGKSSAQGASATTMNLIVTTIERIEDRMIRFEGKMDDMYDIVQEVQRNQKRPINPEGPASVLSDGEDLPSIEPPQKKKKPVILGIPFGNVKKAYEDFFANATEDDWSQIISAIVLAKVERRKLRERVYLRMLDHFSEDDIDSLQSYFIENFPEFVKESISDKRHYQMLNAVGCELVSYGTFLAYLLDSDTQAAADECRILDVAPFGDNGAGNPEAKTLTTAPPNDVPTVVEENAAPQKEDVETQEKSTSSIPRKSTRTPPKGAPDVASPGTSTKTNIEDSDVGKDKNEEDVPNQDKDKEKEEKKKKAEAPLKKAKRGRPAKGNAKK